MPVISLVSPHITDSQLLALLQKILHTMAPFFRLAMIAAIFAAAFVSAAPVDQSKSSPVLQKRSGATVITRCTIPGTVAITFDDGPFLYTNSLLDILKSRAVKATFFFNGNNYGRIEDFAASVKRAYQDGHQVASHAWDHRDLPSLSQSEALGEMTMCNYIMNIVAGVVVYNV